MVLHCMYLLTFLLSSISHYIKNAFNSFYAGSSVHSVVYSHDGSKLAVGVSTGGVEVFDPTSHHHLFTLRDTVTCTEVAKTPNCTKMLNLLSMYVCRYTTHQQLHLPTLGVMSCLPLGIKMEL